jgi:hypothetical protein
VFLAAVGQLRESMARRSASGDLFMLSLLAALRKLAETPTHAKQPSLNAIRELPGQMAVTGYEVDGIRWITVTARPGALRALVRPVEPTAYGRDNPMPATDRAFLDAVRRVQPLLASLGFSAQQPEYGTRVFVQFDFPLEGQGDA